jgi:recombinational DNA repair protein (RecF pathway)
MCKSCYAKHARNRSETKKHTFVFIQNGKPVKRCADCGNVLPVSHFSTDVSKRDGIKATCKKCAETRAEERKIKKAVKKDTMFFEAAPEEYLVNLICQRRAKILAPVAEDIHYLRHLWQETKNNEG